MVAGTSQAPYSSNQNFVLIRDNTDGSLDTSFNGVGYVSSEINGADTLHALAIQPDGKIVASVRRTASSLAYLA